MPLALEKMLKIKSFWLFLLLTLPLITVGCVAPLDLGIFSSPRSSDAVYLPRHRVLFGSYPIYHTASRIEPPTLGKGGRPMHPIEPEDEWRVTHVVPNGYFIQSETYTRKTCEANDKDDQRHAWREWRRGEFCMDPDVLLGTVRYDLVISIRKDGTILDGWQRLATQLGENWFWHEIDYAAGGWPDNQVFIPVKGTEASESTDNK